MKIAFVYSVSRTFWTYVYRKYSWLEHAEYDVQLGVLLDEPYSFHSGWQPVFTNRGYECATVLPGIEPLERAWLQEYGEPKRQAPEGWRVALEQLARFQPDIIYNSVSNWYGAGFFEAIRAAVPSLRMLVGYAGSYTYDVERLNTQDAVVTCSSEIRDAMVQQGLKAFYVPHAFDTNVNRLLGVLPTPKVNKVVFSGSIVRRKGAHLERESLLALVARSLPLVAYTSAGKTSSPREAAVWAVLTASARCALLLRQSPVTKRLADRSFAIRRLSRIETSPHPLPPVDIRKAVRPAVYALDAFRLYKAYTVTLNHSGEYRTAENVRLFESTGVGACLLTDWKQNLTGYFDLDREIVTYKSADECIEKAQWLLAHQDEATRIGEAARRKCTSFHTFENRVSLLEPVLTGVA